jgi:hypothetical protein
MSDAVWNLITLGLCVAVLCCTTAQAWAERRAARHFLEGLDLVRPAMEDIARIEPHLEESIDLALVRLADAQREMWRQANGYVTPFGLMRARRKPR